MPSINPRARVSSSSVLRAVLVIAAACLLPGTAAGQSITDGTTPPSLTPGAPAGSYPLSGFDNVNLFNGNLNFQLPLLSAAGRGGARHAVTLPIEQHWRPEYFPDGSTNEGYWYPSFNM